MPHGGEWEKKKEHIYTMLSLRGINQPAKALLELKSNFLALMGKVIIRDNLQLLNLKTHSHQDQEDYSSAQEKTNHWKAT